MPASRVTTHGLRRDGESQYMAADPDLLLERTAALAGEYLASLSERPVGAREDAVTVAERLRVPLPDAGEDPLQVIERTCA